MENNPLKQYFRRPAIYIRLPSDGQYYEDGVVSFPPNRELPVYPMTVLDEVTVRTPDALFNGVAVVELIKSCVPNILDPWRINSIDLDALIIAIRVASTSGEMDIESTCPKCEESGKYGIDLTRLLANQRNIDYSKPLVLGDLTFKFKPLSYADTNTNNLAQFKIQQFIAGIEQMEEGEAKEQQVKSAFKQLNDTLNNTVASTILSVTTPEITVTEPEFIVDFLKNCDKKTNEAIKNFSIELRQQSEIAPLKIKCVHCTHDYDQRFVLNVTDFFG
jgi:hypothetical protein